ncbi:hypothetical protein ABIE56_000358 [Luteibacter sp. 621]|uniref:hypothetical protein n=1 Tax=Luteibacter sp. 621 TaxID=3373916 RepID=UPI003D1959BF
MSNIEYLAWCAGAFVAFLALIFILVALHRRAVIRRPVFQDTDIEFEIDEAAGELVATSLRQTGVARLPLNTLTWAISTNNLRLTSFKLPVAFAAPNLSEFDKTIVRENVHLWVGNSNQQLVLRWLEHRAGRLKPDLAAHIKQLNAQKKDLAAAARRHLPEVPAVECDTGMLLEHYAYVAFLPSGFVYGMRGADELPEPVSRVRAGDVHKAQGNTVQVEFFRGGQATFRLTVPEMRVLQGLQRKGVLRLEAPVASAY